MSTLPTLAALPLLPDLGGAISDAATAAESAAQGAAASAASTFLLGGIPLGNFVVIIIGLLLIAAGIFSFDKTREIIVGGAKAAAAA